MAVNITINNHITIVGNLPPKVEDCLHQRLTFPNPAYIEKKEHGFNLIISRKIAMDHIREAPMYYTHKKYGLIAIEKKMKESKR